ncbi:MAG TPA: glycosyltransferase [Acidimicrobiales bacterium]|nr:glycosyltransferase [Acidimicrobiales bacterium]
MQQVEVGQAETGLRLEASISGLAERAPAVSVRRLLTRGQAGVLVVVAAVLVGAGIFRPDDTLMALAALVTVTYLVCVLYRLHLFVKSSRSTAAETVTDVEARSVPDNRLPTYSVLVPVYRERAVVRHLVANIGRMAYPAERLEVLLLVEADDTDTIEAVSELDPGPQFHMVLVPPSEPRTKPKALNYGLTLARGELVTVYDAEDEPDPLQLRRAAVALMRLGPEVGCVQAKLSYSNPDQNLITRWFTIEYAMWFSFFLPGLATTGAPIPLGGTSNHFRRRVLRSMGGWDPYNVTEDADLGIRLAREGLRIHVLESVTLEEANSDFVNWVKQRSRWYKGYLQTFLVHMRSPRRLRRDTGWSGMAHFCVFVGGTPLLALLNPVFWFLTVLWFVAHPALIERVFPAPLYYLALACWGLGNVLLGYLTLLSCRLTRRAELLGAAVVVPLYWVMMSVAAVKAFWQLVATPTFWEKTVHGLHLRPVDHVPVPIAGAVARAGAGSVDPARRTLDLT